MWKKHPLHSVNHFCRISSREIMAACVREGVNPMWYPDFLNGQGTSQGLSDLRITFAETLNIFEEREINLFAEVFVHLCVLGECMYVRVCIVCVHICMCESISLLGVDMRRKCTCGLTSNLSNTANPTPYIKGGLPFPHPWNSPNILDLWNPPLTMFPWITSA